MKRNNINSIPTGSYIFTRIYIYVLVIIILIPIVILVAISVTNPSHMSDTFLSFFPKNPTLGNFAEAIKVAQDVIGISFQKMILNSVIVTTLSIIISLIISAFAGFGFSNYKFKGKEFLFVITLLTMMVPIQTYIIPLFLVIKKLNLLNTYMGLVLPYSTIGIPLSVLLFRGFFEGIPKDLKDAAEIDGASDFYYFLKIIIPISRPVIAAVVIFLFLSFWNEFLLALVLIQNYSLQTIPLAMSRMISGKAPVLPPVYASFVMMTVIPILIIFAIFQKWFIKGITAGAIKG
jgi:ABC-type glycerol-3-phosphate transport system permease component